MNQSCELCGTGDNVERHHISYAPEETVPLCRSCHQRVHKADAHELKPDDSRGKTTIQIDKEIRDKLREERAPHESTYGDTLARLLDAGDGGQLWTEQEIQAIAREEIEAAARRLR